MPAPRASGARLRRRLSERFALTWLNYVPREGPTGRSTPQPDEPNDRGGSSHGTWRVCHKHPFEALFVAHRTSVTRRPRCSCRLCCSPPRRSGGFTTTRTHSCGRNGSPGAPQVQPRRSGRLSVAQYKSGHFEEAERNLDSLLADGQHVRPRRGACAARPGVWLAPDKPSAPGGSGFRGLPTSWTAPGPVAGPAQQSPTSRCWLTLRC